METLTLYGFGFSDRSAKVRWLAHELDIPLNEIRVQYGNQRLPEYKALNPFGVVPTAIWKGVTLRESGAICTYIAEQFPESELIVGGSGQEQADFYYWSNIANTFIEADLVRYLLAGAGILHQDHQRLYRKDLVDKLQILAGFVPKADYWMGSKFTLIDIFMGYVLQLAVKSELVLLDNIKPYLLRLMDRPAAQSSKMFAALKMPD